MTSPFNEVSEKVSTKIYSKFSKRNIDPRSMNSRAARKKSILGLAIVTLACLYWVGQKYKSVAETRNICLVGLVDVVLVVVLHLNYFRYTDCNRRTDN